jgi:hypothetical protein
MFPEDGCLHVCRGNDDTITAFTKDGIESLKQIIADMRAGGAEAVRLAVPAQPTNQPAVFTGGIRGMRRT